MGSNRHPPGPCPASRCALAAKLFTLPRQVHQSHVPESMFTALQEFGGRAHLPEDRRGTNTRGIRRRFGAESRSGRTAPRYATESSAHRIRPERTRNEDTFLLLSSYISVGDTPVCENGIVIARVLQNVGTTPHKGNCRRHRDIQQAHRCHLSPYAEPAEHCDVANK